MACMKININYSISPYVNKLMVYLIDAAKR
jgi:hypothetical protein